jgi:hypothetical protein
LQVDSLLYLDKGIAIYKNNKFRNQYVIMTISVPIGKSIKINDHGGNNINVNFDSWNESWDKASFPYEKNKAYKMDTKGLVPI